MKNDFSAAGFLWLLLTLVCLILVVTGLNAALKKMGGNTNRRKKTVSGTAIVLAIWTVLLGILSYNGFFSDFSQLPPRPLLAILVPLPFVVWFAFSKKGTALLQSAPPQWLLWMQSFRIVVELLLLTAFINDMLPVQMTFESWNFDVVTGLLALPVGYVLAQKKSYGFKLAVVFNIIGVLLLLNILVIALLSMPTSLRYFMNEPANTLVGEFPFILLPGILVPLAYTLHIFSLRQLLAKKTGLIFSTKWEYAR